MTVSVDTVYHRFPDFAFESIDAMIAYGTATWPDFEALELWEEQLIPVCSPALLAGTTPEEVLKTARLVDASMDRLDWRRWEAYYPGSTGPDNAHLTFDTLESAIVAVKCSQGIALVDPFSHAMSCSLSNWCECILAASLPADATRWSIQSG